MCIKYRIKKCRGVTGGSGEGVGESAALVYVSNNERYVKQKPIAP